MYTYRPSLVSKSSTDLIVWSVEYVLLSYQPVTYKKNVYFNGQSKMMESSKVNIK